MMLVYGLTAFITSTWIIKSINAHQFILKRTPLDIPLMLFLASQILSTLFSIDPHTSIWGYYSRSNGGLLSLISYLLFYYAFVSNFEAQDLVKHLKALLLGGLMVSLYAIPEHFGASPSCLILTNEISASCWVQDVQARVFATLGQPNWLAAYLEMLIFISLYFLLTAKSTVSKTFYFLVSTIYYLAFTFTYSRGAMLGMVGGIGIFLLSVLGSQLSDQGLSVLRLSATDKLKSGKPKSENRKPKTGILILAFSIVGIFLIINLLFGSAITGDFRLIKQNAPPPRPGLVSQGTQLETGGTESGQIRLIVWKGALEIFKHYPLFGSGVETFGYAYYNFRPVEHNLVSEWDFLYNKAHNEYLNYLATTGLVGFLSYMAIIVGFFVYCIKYIVYRKKDPQYTTYNILYTCLLSGYTAYLIQNFFGFSVVMIALLFFLFPAFAFVSGNETSSFKLANFFKISFVKDLLKFRLKVTGNIVLNTLIITFELILLIILFISLSNFLFMLLLFFLFLAFLPEKFYLPQIATGAVILVFLWHLLTFWTADTFYKNGNDYADSGNAGRAYNLLTDAVDINPFEPLYRSDLGYAASLASVALSDRDATTSANLKDEAQDQTQEALRLSPKNLSLLRTGIRTYYELATIDTAYQQKTLEILDQTHKLAPTDPKILYNKGLVLSQFGQTKEATEALKQAISLKPNYRDAYFTLGTLEEDLKDNSAAISAYQHALQIQPDDKDSMDRLKALGS
jgi:putative inorganic carbon (hco3(-)) transporter